MHAPLNLLIIVAQFATIKFMEDELLDLVNDRDEVIGTILRSEYDRMVAEKLGNIRSIDVFIQNDEGKLWIPTRTSHKKIAPNGLDYSAGGHVGSGETYEESAFREIEEELNLSLRLDDLRFIKKFEPGELPYFRKVYMYHCDQAPDYNPDDFTGAAWMTPAEIIDKIDAGVPAKNSLRETVAYIAKIRRQHGKPS